MRLLLPLLCLVVWVLVAGCGRSEGPVSELASILPLAEVRQETAVIDLTAPAGRAHLGAGWDAEAAGVRMAGGRAELSFFLTDSHDVSLSFTAESPAAAEVRFEANGRPAGAVRLAAGSWIYDLPLAAGLLARGENRLTVHSAPGVTWQELRFQGLPAGGEARATAAGLLALPFGARVDYFVRWPERPGLQLERISARGGAGALLVTVQPAGGGEVEAARLLPGEDSVRLALPALRAGEPVRLSLAAVPAAGAPEALAPGAGLVLARPVLTGTVRGGSGPEPPPGSAADTRAGTAAAGTPAEGRRNLVIYLVDTLRADRLGCYGGREPVSPAIDAFAREATLFRHAVAQSPWTRPSVASMFTGLTPRAHGVHDKRDSLSEEAVTLAEVLRGRGFRTAGVIANPIVAAGFGLGQGFERYELLPGEATAEDVNRRAVELMDGLLGAAGGPGAPPFFLYLHTIDPHGPYDPPEDLRQRFAPGIPPWVGSRRFLRELNHGSLQPTARTAGDLLRLYDGEVAANDRAFGALLRELKRRGLWDDTVVLLVSDHGEEFHEHGGWEHGRSLHSEVLDVPLILRVPGLAEGREAAALAQHVDLPSTLLAALGLPAPAGVEGRNLLATLGSGGSGETAWDPAVYSELRLSGRRGSAVTTPAWRLIERRRPAGAAQLFARRGDPGERRDLARAHPVEAGFLRSLLRARALLPGPTLEPGTGRLDEGMREQLRALGYLR